MVKCISSKNKGKPLYLLEIHSPTKKSLIKAQKISFSIKLHAINMQFHQNWTSLQRPQET